MLLLLALSALAQELPCPEVTLADVASITPPAVVVLGVRGSTEPDLLRTRRVVSRLSSAASVTLALQVLPSGSQQILDRFADGEIALTDLPDELRWDDTVGGPFSGWRWLTSSALQGYDVLAVGPKAGAPPSWQRVTVPTGYASTLARGMPEGAEIDKSLEADFVRSVAHREEQIARQAIQNWDGHGYLVLVVERPHATGLGVPWQARQLTEAPVSSVMMAWAAEPACEPNDKVWKRTLYDRVYTNAHSE